MLERVSLQHVRRRMRFEKDHEGGQVLCQRLDVYYRQRRQADSRGRVHVSSQGRRRRDRRVRGDLPGPHPGGGTEKGNLGQLPHGGHRQPLSRHAGHLQNPAPGGPERQHGPGRGRDRGGQGASGQGDPQPEPSQGQPVRRDQLRRAARHPAGVRTLRVQGGRLHQRRQGQARLFRVGLRGLHPPGRNRGHEPGVPGQVAPSAGGTRIPAPGGREKSGRQTFESSLRPTATWPTWWKRKRSASISSTA